MKIKHVALMLAAAVGTSALTGCHTYYRIGEADPMPSPAPLETKPVIKVTAIAGSKDAESLANHLKGYAQSHLSQKGLVMSDADANIGVELSVARRETARLDDWRVYEGEVRARMKNLSVAAAILAERQFTATGKRGLDEASAEKDVRTGLESQLAGWLDKTVVDVKVPVEVPVSSEEKRGLATLRVVFGPNGMDADYEDVLVAQNLFLETVQRYPGVASCVLVRQDSSRKEFEFAITYEPASYPDGLINTLILRLRRDKNLRLVHSR